MTRQIISTPDAPAAIGTYSQAVRVGPAVYISGQIPLDPATGQLVTGDIEVEIRRVFEAEDFGAAFTPEEREREDRLRAELAAKQQ